jgi:pyruvate dehydrogenase complex dehydrogenase (E1) component
MSDYQDALKKALGEMNDWDGEYHVLGHDGWFKSGFREGVRHALAVLAADQSAQEASK